jgi:hypothetical protein
MSEFQYKAGLHHVGSYQISGIPYVTGGLTAPTGSGTPISIDFPSVTQFITVTNGSTVVSNAYLRVGYSLSGTQGTNYTLVPPMSSITYEVRATKLFLLGNTTAITGLVSVAAGLTGITGYDLATDYSGSNGIG